MTVLRAVDVPPPRSAPSETHWRITALFVVLLWFDVLWEAARHGEPGALPPLAVAAIGLASQCVFCVLEAVLATARDKRMDEAAAEVEARAAVDQWWQAERRQGRPAPPPATLSAEEDRRLRALSFVAARTGDGGEPPFPSAPDTPAGEGEVRDII